MKPNRQQCDCCGHQLVNKTRLFKTCPACKAETPFRWIESDAIRWQDLPQVKHLSDSELATVSKILEKI